MVSFSASDAIEVIVTLNPFAPRLNARPIIPSHNEWATNKSFNPFGFEPIVPGSYPKPGIPLRRPTRDELRIEEGLNIGYGADRGHRSTAASTARRNNQEGSRFVFAQKRTEHGEHTSTTRVPATHACQHPASGSRSPTPTKAVFVKVPRVVGPRLPHSRCVPHARREPILAAPKAIRPLPMWLTHFEDYEDELLAEFCPPSTISSPPRLSRDDYGGLLPWSNIHFLTRSRF